MQLLTLEATKELNSLQPSLLHNKNKMLDLHLIVVQREACLEVKEIISVYRDSLGHRRREEREEEGASEERPRRRRLRTDAAGDESVRKGAEERKIVARRAHFSLQEVRARAEIGPHVDI